MRLHSLVFAAAILAGSCDGSPIAQLHGDGAGPAVQNGAVYHPPDVSVSGLRRLSVAEYRTTVSDLLDVDLSDASSLLPEDAHTPFDDDYTAQTPSEGLIRGFEMLAGEAADAVVADDARTARVVGCTPAGVSDDACFRSFVTSFGRRALRRPLSAAEVDRYAALQSSGEEAGDFRVGVGAVIRAFLQHPEMIYRVEIGTPVAGQSGVYSLNNFEIATRLSYLLLGTTSPDWLLDVAAGASLSTPAGRDEAATRLLDDERARQRVARFHALWLGYDNLPEAGLNGMMRDETAALIDRVIFDENRPWTDMLTASETYLTPELANHYGLPAPTGAAGWVSYGDSGRRGLLSQGTFLSVGSRFGDTSPTQRGKLVRNRLLCQEIHPPPPTVDASIPPTTSDPNACKSERYFMSRQPGCSSCHGQMDPIGFGLENYDAAGRFRTTEPGRPDCPLSGDGSVDGVGGFHGPAGLADMLVQSGVIDQCVATQFYRFAVGRAALDKHDEAMLLSLNHGPFVLLDFVHRLVSTDAFAQRREEEAP